VPLPGGNGNGVSAASKSVCRDFCNSVSECEAFVYGNGMCFGKKDVRTSKCQVGGGYITEMVSVMPYGTCTLMGDPHILPFDNPNGLMGDITQIEGGDYWLLKSDDLQIQARFGFSSRFPAESSTMGIAVYGSLIQNHHLVVEYVGPAKGYQGFKVLWDGMDFLGGSFPQTFTGTNGILKAKLANMNPQDFHDQARHTIGGTSGDLPSYLFELAPDIRIYMLIGEETVNVVLTLRRPSAAGGIDGYCGNFNCQPEDDTMTAIHGRGVAGKIVTGSLFDGAPALPEANSEQQGGGLEKLEDCPQGLMEQAEKACEKEPDGMKKACMFDVCASGDVSVAEEDLAASAVSEEMQGKSELLGFLSLPPFFRATLPRQVQLGCGFVLVLLVSVGLALGWKSKRRSARAAGFMHVLTADESSGEDDEEALLPSAEYDAMDNI